MQFLMAMYLKEVKKEKVLVNCHYCISTTITRDASQTTGSFSEKCSLNFESYFLFLTTFSLKFADQVVENESTLFNKN